MFYYTLHGNASSSRPSHVSTIYFTLHVNNENIALHDIVIMKSIFIADIGKMT